MRLRPAWEDLRSYLTAKGRKRFEVHVCTMAERDYALEMWRLLDPEEHLIGSKQLLDRVVCVKSGKQPIIIGIMVAYFILGLGTCLFSVELYNTNKWKLLSHFYKVLIFSFNCVSIIKKESNCMKCKSLGMDLMV